MNDIVWIVRVEILKDNGTQPLQAPNVFKSEFYAKKYQDRINQDPIYTNIKAFAFCEPAIWIAED